MIAYEKSVDVSLMTGEIYFYLKDLESNCGLH